MLTLLDSTATRNAALTLRLPLPLFYHRIERKPFAAKKVNLDRVEAKRWDACTAETLRALVPAGLPDWTPSPGHEPASQRLLDILQQQRQYSGGGGVGASGSRSTAPSAVTTTTTTSGRRRLMKSSAADPLPLLLLLHGADSEELSTMRNRAEGWTTTTAAAAAAVADRVAAARAALSELGANVRRYGVGEAMSSAGGGGGHSRQGSSRNVGGKQFIMPLRVLDAGRGGGGAAAARPL